MYVYVIFILILNINNKDMDFNNEYKKFIKIEV